MFLEHVLRVVLLAVLIGWGGWAVVWLFRAADRED